MTTFFYGGQRCYEGRFVNLRGIIFFVKLCSVMLESPELKTVFLGLAKRCLRISLSGYLDNGEAGEPNTEFRSNQINTTNIKFNFV